MMIRLEANEIDSIKRNAHERIGSGAKVWLFGSRVDTGKKGGDMDLYIETENKEEIFKKKIKFLARVKMEIGEQKIDVVFDENPQRLIEQEAKRCGVRL
jgi:uncharacterized protein